MLLEASTVSVSIQFFSFWLVIYASTVDTGSVRRPGRIPGSEHRLRCAPERAGLVWLTEASTGSDVVPEESSYCSMS